ncbi:MAG: hypothetical protein LBF94_02915 [Puniceicoccales bacterium]|nr:hypothetical protein [Puniceicoccales bacterium]
MADVVQLQNYTNNSNGVSPVTTLEMEASNPSGKLKPVQIPDDERGMYRILQNKPSLCQPERSGELYHESQANPNICGLHALRHYVGTQWISLKELNAVNWENEINRELVTGAYKKFMEILLGEDRKSSQSCKLTKVAEDILHRTYGDGEKVKKTSEDIEKIITKLNGVADNNWKEIAENMEKIMVLMTNRQTKMLPNKVKDPAGWAQNWLRSCTRQVRECIDSGKEGTSPTAVRDALAKVFPEVRLANPRNDLGLSSDALNLSAVCAKLDNLPPNGASTDRAIICGKGHFIVLRKTRRDGWCMVDSLLLHVVPLERAGRQRSIVEGRPFTGVIYSTQENLGDVFESKLFPISVAS